MQRADFNHFIQIPIRWGDMDAMQHVNNVQFFRFLESGRIAYQDDLLPGEHNSDNVVLADLQCSFIQQLRYPGTVEVATRISRIGNSSMHVRCAIFSQDEEQAAAIGKGVLVWFDVASQQSKRIPNRIREAIIAFETIPPEC